MQNSTQGMAIIALLSAIIGLVVGYGVRGDSMGDHMEGMHMAAETGYGESGMEHMMEDMLKGMKGKTGAELEKAFLDEMIMHHEGAVEMAEELLKGTKRPELVKMGNDIITVQTKEIEMMKSWRAAWFK